MNFLFLVSLKFLLKFIDLFCCFFLLEFKFLQFFVKDSIMMKILLIFNNLLILR